MLDPTAEGSALLGTANARCIGITPQQSEYAPGQIGNQSFPMVLAQPQSGDSLVPGGVGGSSFPVYGEARRCLIDIDPAFGGQIVPGDLVICSTSGYGTKASPFGPWNQWIIGIALTVASSGQSCLVKVTLFPWSPTGS
jgi:hypothetical protein